MIEKIMSQKIYSIDFTSNIYEAATIMKNYDIGFLPITKKNKIVSVITDRDIVVKALDNKSDVLEPIYKYSSKKIITIEKKQSIDDALKIMGDKKVKRLIVVDHKQVVGILSFSDILNNYDHKNILTTIKKITEINSNSQENLSKVNDFYI